MNTVPTNSECRLLFVDDEPHNGELFKLHFEDSYPIQVTHSAKAAIGLLESEAVDVILTDERMPEMTGIQLLEIMAERWPRVVRIIVSAYADAGRLLAAINRGHAHEYVLKPWDPIELSACISRAVTMAKRKRELETRAALAAGVQAGERRHYATHEIVGLHDGLGATLIAARRAARTDATVIIRGESGTGKELVARYLHEESSRARGPFVRVNCAALNDGLLESELFGHEHGAFTGAARTRKGRFELADGGTIFLDEIGDISARHQVALLRVLQEHEFERVGGNKTIKTNVRVIAATHRSLEAMVDRGEFRSDLYYRLNVVRIDIPPLRARTRDIGPLVEHFIAKHAPASAGRPHLSPDALAKLETYPWPGNVRELENLVQRALAFAEDGMLSLNEFGLGLQPAEAVSELRRHAKEDERTRIREALVGTGGNFAEAARQLGLARTTLISRAKRHGLV